MKVGWAASIGVASVVTPFTWLWVPVRMLARLGEHSAFAAKQFSNRHPSSAISSMRGVVFTTEP